MSEGAIRQPPTVSGFATRCAIAALRGRGIDVSPLLRRAGLAGLALNDPHLRLPASAQGEFLESAAEASGDSAFGLHLAERANPREVGLIFYLTSAARNLGEALALFADYRPVANESVRFQLALKPEYVVVEVEFVGVSRHRVKQNTEFWIGVLIKASREITGRHIRPVRVACAHIRNADLKEFERFYGCPVTFGAVFDQLTFSNETLAVPIITRDLHLLETLRPICEQRVRARSAAAATLRGAVENELRRLLPKGRADTQSVARALSISARTLSRRLSEEGTGFSEIVDRLRRNLALQYLAEPGMTSAQIAWLLGYEGATSFNHAFKRWMGHSPSVARTEAGIPPSR